jgi:hypothetical protein
VEEEKQKKKKERETKKVSTREITISSQFFRARTGFSAQDPR